MENTQPDCLEDLKQFMRCKQTNLANTSCDILRETVDSARQSLDKLILDSNLGAEEMHKIQRQCYECAKYKLFGGL